MQTSEELAPQSFSGEKPDYEVAKRDAEAALRLRRDWCYVREILLPQIAERGSAAKG